MVLAAFKRQLTLDVLRQVMRSTLTISSMVFVILLGAAVFSIVFRMMGGDKLVHDYMEGVSVDDRLVILYTQNDLGCAWEGHPCKPGCSRIGR